VATSGILVHLSGGTIEAHFHFFIMLAVISLYQDWRAFLLAIAFVAVHHGVAGVVDARSVFNHQAALAHPWTWAAIHALFVLGESVALVIAWRFSERAHEHAVESQHQFMEEQEQRIEERERAAEALSRSEQRLREAQTIAHIGSWSWNVATGAVEASEELRTIFDVEEGASFDDYVARIHDNDRDEVVENLQHSIDNRDPFHAEMRIVRRDGSTRYLSSSGRVHLDAEGNVTQVFGTAQDVTERMTLENQLLHARKMEAVGQLAGGIAHDFNNLLAVVMNYGHFTVEQLADDHPARQDVQEIIRAAERGASLTRQLLAFSRIEMSRPEVLDLNELIHKAHKLLSRAIREDIRLSLVLGRDLWHVRLDPGEIEQVLLNLAINATDAMPDGGQLTVETRNVSLEPADVAGTDLDDGDYVRIEVTDTGQGIDDKVLDRIFDPFFTTKAVGSGTGLGLATAYAIVQGAGGRITARSEPGVGTTFTVDLPRSSSDADAGEAEELPAGSRQGNGETILVVEDEPAVLDAALRILGGNGYNVLGSPKAIDALGIVGQGTHIDLLLTDVVMPDMSGNELAQLAGVNTLFMSGYTNQLLDDRGISGEDVAVVRKPFAANELLKAVHYALMRSSDAERASA
ncbi:MAG TPA: ATP-binding protein, partial [Actinomycetota bacterium]|nr:ATP-binding protein [Actinomycetota bacterium]